jgi:hypothetical protein
MANSNVDGFSYFLIDRIGKGENHILLINIIYIHWYLVVSYNTYIVSLLKDIINS